jgi:hypothetical protein
MLTEALPQDAKIATGLKASSNEDHPGVFLIP